MSSAEISQENSEKVSEEVPQIVSQEVFEEVAGEVLEEARHIITQEAFDEFAGGVYEEIPEIVSQEVFEEFIKEVPEEVLQIVSKEVFGELEEVPQEVPRIVPQEAIEEISKEVPQIVSQEASKEVSEEARQKASQDLEKILKEVAEEISQEVSKKVPQEVSEEVPEEENKFPILINDRILKAVRGEKPDKLPVWIMCQAGTYLPEFMKFRKQYSFFEICQTPSLACEVTLMFIRKYDLDAALIFSNILVIPQALGMTVVMRMEAEPVLPKPLTTKTIKKLKTNNVISRLKYVGEAITLTRHKLEGKVPLIGFSGAPWTLMGYMIEGGSSDTLIKAKKWLYTYPGYAHRLLNLLTKVIIDYLVMQIEAGAQLVQLFDSSAEHLNKTLYIRFGLPYLKKISDGVKSRLNKLKLEPVPLVLFAKGAHCCLEEQAELGYDVLSVDWTMAPSIAREILSDKKIAVQGNLDPCALYAPKEDLTNIVKDMINKFGINQYIVNLGHDTYPDDASLDAIQTVVDAVHSVEL